MYSYSDRKRDSLIRWLTKKCNECDDICDDPGYSNGYKRYFNIVDSGHVIYCDNDIDNEINLEYDDPLLEEFTDYVPIKGCSDEEKKYIVNKMTHKNIVIPPGSNQSNANFMFKLLNEFGHKYSYKIPCVSNNPSDPYDGDYESICMDIDKESFYMFMFDNS